MPISPFCLDCCSARLSPLLLKFTQPIRFLLTHFQILVKPEQPLTLFTVSRVAIFLMLFK